MPRRENTGTVHRRLRLTASGKNEACHWLPQRFFWHDVKDNRRRPHVFLPAAGNRNGTSVNNVGSNGNYWSSSYNNANNAYNVNFNDSNLNTDNNHNRYNGQSVRLVRSAQHFSRVFLFQ